MRGHDAQHTVATLMLAMGESPKTVHTLLGHSTIARTLDIDSHVSLDLERRAAARLNAVLHVWRLPLMEHKEHSCHDTQKPDQVETLRAQTAGQKRRHGSSR
jgi:hypothetical protein